MASLNPNTVSAKWPAITVALSDFDVALVAANHVKAEAGLLAAIRHTKKAESAIICARRLATRPQIWDQIPRATRYGALDMIQEFPGVGPGGRYHVARNLGWDCPNHTGFTKALADNLGTDCDTLGDYLAAKSGFRVSTTDHILYRWSRLFDDAESAIGEFRGLLRTG